jgi:hypothetical protein
MGRSDIDYWGGSSGGGGGGSAANGLPPGGADGQVLAKASSGDYDADWVDPVASSGYHHHQQTVAATQWDVVHSLSYPPAVTVVDNSGTVLNADVQYLDSQHIQIRFSVPTAGSAYCT